MYCVCLAASPEARLGRAGEAAVDRAGQLAGLKVTKIKGAYRKTCNKNKKSGEGRHEPVHFCKMQEL